MVLSLTGQGSREVPGPSIRARSRALLSLAPDVGSECSSSDENEVSRARKESRADFLEVSLRLLYHSKWRLAAYGGFSREENIIVLEARSILYAVRHAESNYPSGRLLIFSSNLALVPALCKGHTFFTLLSVMRRIFASGFRAGFVLSFKGNRFFNRDYDPSKSLLHVRPQRIARSSPAQTNDQDSLSPSLKGLPSLGRRIASPFWCLMVLVFR